MIFLIAEDMNNPESLLVLQSSQRPPEIDVIQDDAKLEGLHPPRRNPEVNEVWQPCQPCGRIFFPDEGDVKAANTK
jgi:hypothetical protein